MPEREQHLPGRGRVRDARAAELRDALHDGRALHEVDRDRVVLTRNRQRRRLARLRDERLQVRPGERAQVEPCEHGVPELDEAQRRAGSARLGTCSTKPAAASVASRRETVLALIPVRRAISFVPSSPPSASVSSTAIARSTAATWRTAG